MWWEPTSDWERVLAEDVRELRRWKFEDPIASEIGCFGTGRYGASTMKVSFLSSLSAVRFAHGHGKAHFSGCETVGFSG